MAPAKSSGVRKSGPIQKRQIGHKKKKNTFQFFFPILKTVNEIGKISEPPPTPATLPPVEGANIVNIKNAI